MSDKSKMTKAKLDHGMLLDAKDVMDNVICRLNEFKKLIPECLHNKAASIISDIQDELAQCDVSEQYVEKSSKLKDISK